MRSAAIQQHRSRSAFTLLEVMLAVVVFSIVLTAIHGVYYAAFKLRNKTTEAIEAALPRRQILTLIRRDIENLVPNGGTISGEFQSASVATTETGQVSPAFHTTTGAVNDSTPWPDVQQVVYLLVNSTNRDGGRDLIRSVTRNPLPAITAEPVQQWLASSVKDLTFSFYDGTQWRDTWDSTSDTPPLPTAIKVQLEFVPADDQASRSRPLKDIVEMIVPLLIVGKTNQTSTSSSSAGGGA